MWEGLLVYGFLGDYKLVFCSVCWIMGEEVIVFASWLCGSIFKILFI